MKIEAQFAVGEYQIVILSATDSPGLETWLRREKLQHPRRARPRRWRPTSRDKSKFFVAKVDIKKVKRDAQGVVQLSPLRFHFDANELRLPVRLGPAQRGRQAGPDRLRPPPDVALRGRELPERVHPDEPRGRGRRAQELRRRSTPSCSTPPSRRWDARPSSPSTRGRRPSCDPVPDAAAARRGSGDARPRRARGSASRSPPGGRRRRADAPASRSTAAAGVGAHPPAHALQQGDAVRGSRSSARPSRSMGGRANWNGTNGDEGAAVSRRRRRTTSRAATSSATTGTEPVACKDPHYDQWGGPPGNPRQADADRGQGAGDRAAREGRAEGGGALAGAAARASPGKPPHAAEGGDREPRRRAARGSALGLGRQRRDDRGRRRADRARVIAARRVAAPLRAARPRRRRRAAASRKGPATRRSPPRSRGSGFYAGAPVGGGDCIGCHHDVAAQWASSAHRFSSFNNPYYRVATDEFRAREGRGRVALLRQLPRALPGRDRRDGSAEIDRGTRAAQAGVTCLVCHSIAHVDREGNGRYEADLRAGADREGRARRAAAAGADVAGACSARLPQGRPRRRRHRGRALAARPERLRRLAHQRRVGQRRGLGVSARGARRSSARTATCRSSRRCRATRPRRTAWSARTGSWARTRRCRTCAATPSRNGARREQPARARVAGAALVGPDARRRAAARARRRPPLPGRHDGLERGLAGGDRVRRAPARRSRRRAGAGATARSTPTRTWCARSRSTAHGAPLARRDPQHQRGVAFDAALTPSDPQVVRFEVPARHGARAGAAALPQVHAGLRARSPAPTCRRSVRGALPGPADRRDRRRRDRRGRAAHRRSGDAGRLGARARGRDRGSRRGGARAARGRARDVAGARRAAARPGAAGVQARADRRRRPLRGRGAGARRRSSGGAGAGDARADSTPTASRAARPRRRAAGAAAARRSRSRSRCWRARAASPATPRARSPPPTVSWRSIPNRRKASTSARSRSPSSAAPDEAEARGGALRAATASRSRPISRCATAGARLAPRPRRRIGALPHAPAQASVAPKARRPRR